MRMLGYALRSITTVGDATTARNITTVRNVTNGRKIYETGN